LGIITVCRVRGDLLAKLGRFAEARPEFERELLLGLARACAAGSTPPEPR